MNTAQQPTEIIHATCVSFDTKAILILGASGSGKSSLALQLISLGAVLVSDDRTILTLHENTLHACSPDTITGLIEARGVGILRLPSVGRTPIALAVDLDKPEKARLPDPHGIDLLGITLPCLWNATSPHFASAILHYLAGGVRQHL